MKKGQGTIQGGKKKAISSPTDASHHATQSTQPLPPTKLPQNSAPLTPNLFQPGISQPQNAPKVAIPRLRRDSEGQASSKVSTAVDKNRVAHACEPCRHRKTKCSGERPECQHCLDFKLTCLYADGKRDRTRKQLGSLAGRVEEYEKLLRELSLRAGEHDQEMIQKALDMETIPEDDDDMVSLRSARKQSIYDGAAGEEPSGENDASGRAGSTESLDRISEDFNHPAARATGFHGKNSELTWIQRLKRQTTRGSDESDEGLDGTLVDGESLPSSQTDHVGAGLTPISQSTYHCDDLTISVPDQVDPFEVPPQTTADLLFQVYLDTVHPAFPIIGKNTFVNQYQVFFSGDKSSVNHNWLAILNFIFAIGAKYSHLVLAQWRGDERDHLIYFTRARMLGFNSESILGHAELQGVQVAGLMAFYLMAINQVNRSWSISGIAIRQASTLGLNLINDTKNVTDASKEIRYRVWWALCSIERILSTMTGRPTSFGETDCTAPLPLPLDEEALFGNAAPNAKAIRMLRRLSSEESWQNNNAISSPSSGAQSARIKGSPVDSSSPGSRHSSQDRKQTFPPSNSLFFQYHTKLSTFSNEVLNRIYRADAMKEPWAHIQATISELNLKLEKWRMDLPTIFDFTRRQRDQHFVRQRMSLGFSYYSTMTIINRPCLCRVNRRIPNQSGKAKDFNRVTAAKCVHAARDMLEMLPDQPNPVGLYKVAPWWCLVHNLMQAASVSMLELSFRADHMPNEVQEVFDSAKKAVGWLRSMKGQDEAARRAWKLSDEMLRKVAPKVGRRPEEASDHVDSADLMQGLDVSTVTMGGLPSHHVPPYSTAPFPPHMFTSYDQFLSYDQLPTTSASGPFNDMFPTAHDMDAMGSDVPGYFSEQDPRWFPGTGA